MEDIYFFDTYAILEIIDGNANYRKYSKARAIITNLNLFELDYCLRRRGLGLKESSEILARYSEFEVRYGLKVIRGAVGMKLSNKRLSPADCIGYRAAQEYGVKFLTGDKEFEGMLGVEFVK